MRAAYGYHLTYLPSWHLLKYEVQRMYRMLFTIFLKKKEKNFLFLFPLVHLFQVSPYFTFKPNVITNHFGTQRFPKVFPNTRFPNTI